MMAPAGRGGTLRLPGQPLLPRTVGIMSQSGSVQVNATRAFTVGGCRQATVNFTEVPSEDSEAVNHDGGSLA